MSMTIEQAKSEIMQIYGALSPDKQRAIDTLMKIEPCEDAISRQAVINAINQNCIWENEYNLTSSRIKKAVESLPPVNPQEPCDKCVYSTKDGYCQYDDITETIPPFEPSGDMVSLETVIEWLKTKDIIKLSSQEETARKELKALPPVNPQEPKYCDRNICIKNEYNGIGCDECEVTKSQELNTGHWLHDGSHWKNRFICSECGYKLFDEPTNYCPNCGARMAESEDKE